MSLISAFGLDDLRGLDAREYLRVSKDRWGNARSTGDQHVENREAAERYEWSLGEAYVDENRSASRYATKVREDFLRLVEDLEADRFGAQVLILWENSRGGRKTGEWAHLCDLLEERGVIVYVTSHGRSYDPARPRDRRALMEDAVDAEYESGKTSERVLRDIRQNAARGGVHGTTPYGYRRRYDERTGRLIAQEPYEPEASTVREMYERAAAGHSLKSIARWLDERGIPTPSGLGSWHDQRQQLVRQILVRPAYAGLRKHQPIAGGPASLYDASWEPLVKMELWQQVNTILTDPERGKPGKATHLASNIVTCDVCGQGLAAKPKRKNNRTRDKIPGRRDYFCNNNGHVRVDADDVDDFATAAVLDYLTDPINLERLTKVTVDNSHVQALRADITKAEFELKELVANVKAGKVSALMGTAAQDGLEDRIAAAKQRLREIGTPPEVAPWLEDAETIEDKWKTAPISAKRDLLRFVLSPDRLGELRIMRRPKNTGSISCPVEGRVRFRRDGET